MGKHEVDERYQRHMEGKLERKDQGYLEKNKIKQSEVKKESVVA